MAQKKAVIVVGMAYGDEAKGATTDFLCRDLGVELVVRFNGAHQAAHNVCLADGRHHTFSQFGSGSFIPSVRTHLSRFMLVNPAAMMLEEEHLSSLGVTDLWSRLTVDESCVVVTPFHRAYNRLEELHRGHRAHGSCGVGIGVARRLEISGLALRAGELSDWELTRRRLHDIKARLGAELRAFSYELELNSDVQNELYWFQNGGWDFDQIQGKYTEWVKRVRIVPKFTPADVMVFEGAQGVLLDETHGTSPHNTWTNTTFENAQTLLREAKFSGEIRRLGCWRSYFTRHGAGPLHGEQDFSTALDWFHVPELHNSTGRYQGSWRIGCFDHASAKYAVKVCGGIDEISLSHMDYVADPTGAMWVDQKLLEEVAQAPVTLLSYGPTAGDRKKCLNLNRASDAPVTVMGTISSPPKVPAHSA